MKLRGPIVIPILAVVLIALAFGLWWMFGRTDKLPERRQQFGFAMGGPFVSPGGKLSEGEPSALDQSWNEQHPKA